MKLIKSTSKRLKDELPITVYFMMEDAFHAEMRRRMKENYYLNSGKEKQQVRNYLKRYNLGTNFFAGNETETKKVEKLKQYVEDARKMKRQSVRENLSRQLING